MAPGDDREGSRKIKVTSKHLDENLMHNQPYMEDIILKTLAEQSEEVDELTIKE